MNFPLFDPLILYSGPRVLPPWQEPSNEPKSVQFIVELKLRILRGGRWFSGLRDQRIIFLI
jgi:hypothetical protein